MISKPATCVKAYKPGDTTASAFEAKGRVLTAVLRGIPLRSGKDGATKIGRRRCDGIATTPGYCARLPGTILSYSWAVRPESLKHLDGMCYDRLGS